MEETDLEFSLVSIGFFLDYWAAPRIPTHLTNTPPLMIDMAHNFAAIPGDGTTPVTLTHSRDVGYIVPLMLGLPRWDRKYVSIGDRVTLNEVVRIAKRVKGVKFEVHYDDIEKLQKGDATLTPRDIGVYQRFPRVRTARCENSSGSRMHYLRNGLSGPRSLW